MRVLARKQGGCWIFLYVVPWLPRSEEPPDPGLLLIRTDPWASAQTQGKTAQRVRKSSLEDCRKVCAHILEG